MRLLAENNHHKENIRAEMTLEKIPRKEAEILHFDWREEQDEKQKRKAFKSHPKL